MNLVEVGKDYFINMDYIEAIWKDPDNIEYKTVTISSEFYRISESAYNTILKYGKAKKI
jgi:hypothetical protein